MSVWTRILLRYLLGYLVFYNIIPADIAAMIRDDPELSMLIGGALAAAVEGLTVVARRLGWKT